MVTFRDFEEIHVWQEARKLIQNIRLLCKRESFRKDFSLVDQITRSSRSIAANIAEGNDALTTKEFITFLGHAKRSAAEVRSHLYDALDEQYISQKEFDDISDHTKQICRMIAGLIHHLQSLDHKQKRTYKQQPINQFTN